MKFFCINHALELYNVYPFINILWSQHLKVKELLDVDFTKGEKFAGHFSDLS